MKRIALLVAMFVLGACSRTTTSNHAVFEHAFGSAPPPGVEVIHGKLWENNHYFVFYEQDWKLELSGLGAKDFVFARWPDLKPQRAGWVYNEDAPWFTPKHPNNYEAWTSKQDYAVTVLQDKETQHVFVVYMAL